MAIDARAKQSQHAIIEGAEQEFLRFGFRKTSMEGIARTVGIAKATLYAHFPTKQAVFDAVCARRARLIAERSRAASGEAKDPRAAAVASLTAKFTEISDFVRHSAHGEELLQAALAQNEDETEKAHAEYLADLAQLLERGLQMSAKDALELADVAERAAEGVLRASTSGADLQRKLALLLGLLFAQHDVR